MADPGQFQAFHPDEARHKHSQIFEDCWGAVGEEGDREIGHRKVAKMVGVKVSLDEVGVGGCSQH